jgi:hypothetical protein
MEVGTQPNSHNAPQNYSLNSAVCVLAVGYTMTITRTKTFNEAARQVQDRAAASANGDHALVVQSLTTPTPGADPKPHFFDGKSNEAKTPMHEVVSNDPLVALIRERLGSGAEQTSSVGSELGYRVPLAASKHFPGTCRTA